MLQRVLQSQTLTFLYHTPKPHTHKNTGVVNYTIPSNNRPSSIRNNANYTLATMTGHLLAAKHAATVSAIANTCSVRHMSSSSSSGHNNHTKKILTHVDQDGKAYMVDVGHKKPTQRVAIARAHVYVGHEIGKLIVDNSVAKGDVLSVSQIAGIVAAKRTSELIPLCHNIPLSSVNVRAELDAEQRRVVIHATVKCEGRTGVEMEALTACATAALTIYDMCKALSQDIVVQDVMLLKKSGGKVNYQRRNDGKVDREEPIVLKYKTDPITDETFVPTHI